MFLAEMLMYSLYFSKYLSNTYNYFIYLKMLCNIFGE